MGLHVSGIIQVRHARWFVFAFLRHLRGNCSGINREDGHLHVAGRGCLCLARFIWADGEVGAIPDGPCCGTSVCFLRSVSAGAGGGYDEGVSRRPALLHTPGVHSQSATLLRQNSIIMSQGTFLVVRIPRIIIICFMARLFVRRPSDRTTER